MEANNNKAMREALEAVLKCINLNKTCTVTMDCKHNILNYEKQIKAALSAPLLNCEVGTAEEQFHRHMDYCSEQKSCGDNNVIKCVRCFAQWAQMPYESEVK